MTARPESTGIGRTGAPAPQTDRDRSGHYLAAERDTGIRHEYVDGVSFAMTGASRAHYLPATPA